MLGTFYDPKKEESFAKKRTGGWVGGYELMGSEESMVDRTGRRTRNTTMYHNRTVRERRVCEWVCG
jgi:hypothetical protein